MARSHNGALASLELTVNQSGLMVTEILLPPLPLSTGIKGMCASMLCDNATFSLRQDLAI